MVKIKNISIKEIVQPDVIELNVSVANRDEAIYKAGYLLLKKGIVEEGYIEAMLKACNELGPYIVLVPGIAIPHARPEAGAKGLGISIITLKEPIPFGNEENDPVHTVIALASDNNNNHLGLLTSLSNFLMDHEKVNKMRAAKTTDEVMALLTEND
ncbi:Phosphotransferase system mannitol/fructose-specific IIA domain (Ntr-type) [Maledivibacter halophilus]|uniref:Ascorbate-specific PTS system EIIA component n=1 Tax=Maledivibacter halophilus TaxID=36842 RepID=A0A1T5MJH6_9FIRM|nr:Phosphotransferase system mannitol/fructose-specific IIA domain (Ntr-type) [Maledivibacter halophilus]